MGQIKLVETGQTWSDWASVAATSTGAMTGGLGGKDLSALSSVTLEQTGDCLGSGTTIQFTKGSSVPLIIRAAGFDRTAELTNFVPYRIKYTSSRPKIDCNAGDTGLSLANLSNITIQGLQIANGNTNSSSASMIRFSGITGTNVMEFCDWIQGAIASRYTGSSGDMTVQYCNVIGHGYGAFRFGAGQSGNVVDIGNIVIQYCNTRWNRGYMSTAQRIAMGTPLLSADYTATDSNQTIGFHGCLVLKNALSITVQYNHLDGAGQFQMVLENTPTMNIYNNKCYDSGTGVATGGLISLTPNSGATPTVNMKGNLIMNLNGGVITSIGSNLIDFEENTIIELRKQIDSASNVIITGNAKNVISMTTSGSLKAINNLMIGNPANNSAFFSFGASGAITSFVADYNSYDRGGNASRGFTSNFVGTTNIGTVSQTTYQGQDQSGFDSAFTTREAHGKFTSGTTSSVTNPEILRQLYRRLPAPASATSTPADIIYPVFNPYPCTMYIVDANGCTISGMPTGVVAANSTTNITVNGLAGQIPTIALKSLF